MPAQRVLVVDDQPNVAILLAASLETMGDEFILEVAHDGQAALAKIGQTAYTLLITDYKMSGLNGLQLAEQAHQISPETQIILMTAYGTDELRQMAGRLQLSGYIEKPFTVSQIRQLVEQIVAIPNELDDKAQNQDPEPTY